MSAGTNNVAIAVGAAAAAGGLLSATGVLQQRAAAQRPQGESLSPRLLWSLAHNRMWLFGVGTGFASYGFQSLALAFGPLALVQPVFLSELVFAVPVSIRLNRMRMTGRLYLGLLLVLGGLSIGIISAWPQHGSSLPAFGSWMLAVGAIAAAAAVAIQVGRKAHGPARSSLYAFAGAAIMALQSGLLAATVALMKLGVVPLFTSWQPYALIPVTGAGIIVVMSAYQAGPLAASMPVVDGTEPTIAVIIGLVLFDEQVHTGPWNLAGAGIGIAMVAAGIVLLDTSPVVHALQRKQAADEDRSGILERVR